MRLIGQGSDLGPSWPSCLWNIVFYFQVFFLNVIMIECTLQSISRTMVSIILDNVCDNIRKHETITNYKTPNVCYKTYHLPLMTILIACITLLDMLSKKVFFTVWLLQGEYREILVQMLTSTSTVLPPISIFNTFTCH
jgi:hypothetical protein